MDVKPSKPKRKATTKNPTIPVYKTVGGEMVLGDNGLPIIIGYLPPDTKHKPKCNDPKSDTYGKHETETWGSDPRFDICKQCKTVLIKPVEGLPPVSDRRRLLRTWKSAAQVKKEIAAASIDMFADDPAVREMDRAASVEASRKRLPK